MPNKNYKNAQWGLFSMRTNELTAAVKVERRNINNVIKDATTSQTKKPFHEVQ